jgi:FkbM family methyltransferase
MKYYIKILALYLVKIIKFFNFTLFYITRIDFLSHLMFFLREASYTTIRICDKNIIFFTPNLTTKSRVNSFFTKEPETLEWIDNFQTGKKIIFWDIGGNIGLYSIYASLKHRNINITTFEPSTSNLHILSRNISINNQSKNIKICQIPLTNKKNSFLYMRENKFEEGGSLNVFGEDFDFNGNKFFKKKKKEEAGRGTREFNEYKIFGSSINYLLDEKILEIPNYIKIDVDGIEHLILLGADKYLKNLNIKSLSIEINENFTVQFKSVLNIMRANGFKILHKKHSEKIFKNSKTYNYVFVR